jgi:hypothetical protein
MSDEGIIFDVNREEGSGEKGGLAMLVNRNARQAQKEEQNSQETSESEAEKFDAVVYGSSNVLFKTKAVFPFDFFPDQVIIDPNKVNLIRKSFFLTEKLHSIPIKNITDVYVQTAPIFASLHIMDNSVANNVIIVKYLWKKDAERVRRVIQGLMDAAKHEVDIHKLTNGTISRIREKLFQAGRIPTPHISIKL